MARNRYHHRVECASPSCGKSANYDYETRAEQAKHMDGLRKHPWRCTRHTAPDELLSAASPSRQVTLVSDGKFWCDGEKQLSGFNHGTGFRVFAEDVPVGTTLTITATLGIPAVEKGAV